MNKERRQKLEDVISMLSDVDQLLTEIKNDEEEALDNLPENLADSERAEKMGVAVEFMEDAIASIEQVVEFIQEAQEQ